MSSFTPLSGVVGGSLIGLSAGILLIFNGDIMGASGIASSLLIGSQNVVKNPQNHWKIVFMTSFMLTIKIFVLYNSPLRLVDDNLGKDISLPIVSGTGSIVSGFLVGFGTKLGNGCTTGHGICGLARFSIRSLAAVLTFMATGIISATVCSPTCPLAKYLRADKDRINDSFPYDNSISFSSAMIIALVLLFITTLIKKCTEEEKPNLISSRRKLLPAAVSGSLFAIGLLISGMIYSSKIYGFLDFNGFSRRTYDPTLIFVMGGGLFISFISYQFVLGWSLVKNALELDAPLTQKKGLGKFNIPKNMPIDSYLVIGEALFGLGWGIGGLCPGPALVLLAAGFPHVAFRWFPAFVFGSFLGKKVKEYPFLPKKFA